MNAVQKAVEIIGSQAAMARVCQQRPQAVTRWLREGRVPPKHAGPISIATGGEVSRHALCPDVFGPAPDAAPDEQSICADAQKVA